MDDAKKAEEVKASVVGVDPFQAEGVVPRLRRRPAWLGVLAALGSAVLSLGGLASLMVLVLALAPSSWVEATAYFLQGPTPREGPALSLTFLDDVRSGDWFAVKGKVLNRTTENLVQVEAVLKLYGASGALLNTLVVPLSRDPLPPNEEAEFRVTFPRSRSEISGYSVAFKERGGAPVAHRDARTRQP
ncbi:MAG: hypothetical protein HY652_06430 [Acidobacteria bacterium]|nr:hypothetical protein [Acidobacteriota bacterium]